MTFWIDLVALMTLILQLSTFSQIGKTWDSGALKSVTQPGVGRHVKVHGNLLAWAETWQGQARKSGPAYGVGGSEGSWLFQSLMIFECGLSYLYLFVCWLYVCVCWCLWGTVILELFSESPPKKTETVMSHYLSMILPFYLFGVFYRCIHTQSICIKYIVSLIRNLNHPWWELEDVSLHGDKLQIEIHKKRLSTAKYYKRSSFVF